MKSLKLLLVVFSVYFAFSGCSNLLYSKKRIFSIANYNKIAVLDFEGVDKEKGKALAESFVPILMNAGFDVIEREQIDKVIKEQNLAMTGLVDNSSDMYKAFKMAGVKVVLGGNFHLSKKQNRTTTKTAGDRKHRQQTQTTITTDSIFDSISVRIIDVNTAEILFSASSKEQINEANVDDFFKDVVRVLK